MLYGVTFKELPLATFTSRADAIAYIQSHRNEFHPVMKHDKYTIEELPL